jgi:hypothetical protein
VDTPVLVYADDANLLSKNTHTTKKIREALLATNKEVAKHMLKKLRISSFR